MNLLLFTPRDRLDAQTLAVSDARLTHLRNVHRAAVGDTVRVGEVNGLMGEGVITGLDTTRATLQISLTQPPPPKLPVTLVLALPRPKMLRRILRNIAELGVSQLHLVNSYRVEKSYWQTPVLEAQTIEHYLLQGLEQARDTRLPTVSCHRRFKPFVEDQLGEVIGRDTAVVLHPGDHQAFAAAPDGGTILIIGPEGGFIPYEIDMLQAAGCALATLGPRILRVENAVNVALGRYLARPS